MQLPLKRDQQLTQRLIKSIVESQFPKGSWKGSIGWTAHRLHQLSELGVKGNHPSVQRALSWLLERQTHDGNFLERPRIPTVYPSPAGDDFITDNYSISFTAYLLEGLLPWIPDSEAVQKAFDFLLYLYKRDGPCCVHCASLLLSVLREGEPQHDAIRQDVAAWLAKRQTHSGTWFGSYDLLFVALYGLSFCPLPEAKQCVSNALPLLAHLQYKDAGFGRSFRAEKTLIVARALIRHDLMDDFHDYIKSHPECGRDVRLLKRYNLTLERSSVL